MKLGSRILISYLFLFGIGFYFLINWVQEDLQVRYRESLEEAMVDQANILAVLVAEKMQVHDFKPTHLKNIFTEVYQRRFSAKIYKLQKERVDTRVYITDHVGKVIFDSENNDKVGKDYSQWRDVFLTLRGKYGARSTRKKEDDPTSTVLYVAAPILINGKIQGVVSVAKPTTNIQIFIEAAQNNITRIGAIAALAVALFSIVVMLWITHPVKKLTEYAENIRRGKRASLPRLDQSEIGDMGRAFERMREALEGKKYVEQYVQTLAHEIKSPTSAIKGAAELLQENNMPDKNKLRFLSNILNETERVRTITDRMLELSAVESLMTLQNREILYLNEVVLSVIESLNPILLQRKIEIRLNLQKSFTVNGDLFLLKQAISNLVQNAVDFSSDNDIIEMELDSSNEHSIHLVIKDNGPGIPPYATDKIFDKFFSLQRPHNKKKSTGLGLNLVREVAELHDGEIILKNRSQKGLRAIFSLPANTVKT